MSEIHQKLFRAIWKNHLEEVRELICQVSEVDVIDEESGWSPLHKALYFGHLLIATHLIKSGASLQLTDKQGLTPLDLIHNELSPSTGSPHQTEVFSWGSGVNYQLGTGKTGLNQPPGRLESLTLCSVNTLAAGKFHNLALTSSGEVYSWGWGRGGRLGLPESRIQDQDGARILPSRIPGLRDKIVRSIAVAKHHSLAVLVSGEVYSWGLNRDGRLGYTTVNKQVTPKRIQSLKSIHAISAAAANKHSAVLTSDGEVYTWGSNAFGQLGYGTSDSASNPAPQRVDGLQHKSIGLISLSKRHSLALTREGEVYSWGNKLVAPKKVSLIGVRDQDLVRSNGEHVQFHRGVLKVKKPLVVGLAAGVEISGCFTTTGSVFCWNSASPKNSIFEVKGSLTGKKAISISAGKSMMAVVTSGGQVYSWDAQIPKKSKQDFQIVPKMVEGLRNVSTVAVGEKHCLVLQNWRRGQSTGSSVKTESLQSHHSSSSALDLTPTSPNLGSELEDLSLHETDFSLLVKSKKNREIMNRPKLKPLQVLCEIAVSENVLTPRTVLSLYNYSDTIGAQILKTKCLEMILLNLDLVIYETKEDLVQLPEHLLLEIEQSYQKEVLELNEETNEDWWLNYWTPNKDVDITSRRPTYNFSIPSTSTPLASFSGSLSEKEVQIMNPLQKENRFMPKRDCLVKIKRTVVKKLEQIEVLLRKEESGLMLDQWQRLKLMKKSIFERTLQAIDSGKSYDTVQGILQEANQMQNPLNRQQNLPVVKIQEQDSRNDRKQEQDSRNDRKQEQDLKLNKNQKQDSRLDEIKKQDSRFDKIQKQDFRNESKQRQDFRFERNQEQDSWKDIKLQDKRPELLPRFLEPKPAALESSWIPVQSNRDKKTPKPVIKAPPLRKSEDPCPSRRKLSLADFVPPQPTPTESTSMPPRPRERGPAWGGVSLKNPNRSFQSIQKEQMNHRPGYWLPDGDSKPAVERMKTVAKWQVPCDVQIQSINSIQVEERAVRELSELYKGAEVRVKIGTAKSGVNRTKDKC